AVSPTELFCTYMKPLCRASRGKTGEADTGKRDYRHHARTGCVEKREVVPWCFSDPHRRAKATGVTRAYRGVFSSLLSAILAPEYLRPPTREASSMCGACHG